MTGPLLLGLDVGGTSTRVLVADRHGRILATARADGANPVAHGPALAARRIAAALTGALAELDPAAVEAAVLGLAGGLTQPATGGSAGPGPGTPFSALLAEVWEAAGLRVVPRLVGDVELAYAAGTSRPDGSVLVAGTGAVAADCRDFAPHRVADGHGWLLGDLGSGYWLGREAVRLVLALVDAQGDLTGGLAATVLAELGLAGAADLRGAVISRVHAEPPVRLARLAPPVLAAAEAGDPAAAALVGRAADHLLETLATVRPAGSTLPVVLAGGVLSETSPLARAVRARVAARWPGAEILPAGSGAGAAAWLAGRDLGLPGADTLHAPLVRPPDHSADP